MDLNQTARAGSCDGGDFGSPRGYGEFVPFIEKMDSGRGAVKGNRNKRFPERALLRETLDETGVTAFGSQPGNVKGLSFARDHGLISLIPPANPFQGLVMFRNHLPKSELPRLVVSLVQMGRPPHHVEWRMPHDCEGKAVVGGTSHDLH